MLGEILLRFVPPAKLVSAWNHRMRRYDYYLVPEGVSLRPGEPPAGRPAFGEALEVLLPSLPKAAVKVGSGTLARGRIVVKRNGGGSLALGAALGAALDWLEG